ncbi:MAG: deoxyuridine 5'-triphosphate nucleotidohydrolase [Haloarculaceae archaeon]
MFRSGAFVAEHVSPTDDDQVQPNGVDLTLGAVYEQVGPGHLGRSGKTVGERRVVEPELEGTTEAESGDETGAPTYRFDPGGYVAEYGEQVRVPEGHVGFVLPRSSLMRNSCMLHTAVWDAGYEGRGEGLLEVHHEITVERGARFAQFVLAAADHEGTYEGSYQGERL